MSLPKHLSSYMDIPPILDALRRVGGGTYEPVNSSGDSGPGVAIYWIHRVNHMRKLQREELRRTGPYDDARIKLACGCRKKCDHSNGHLVTVEFTKAIPGTIRDLTGKVIPAGPMTEELAEALNMEVDDEDGV